MGFLIGLLTGAVVALLYAPKPGDLTREELKMRSDELKRRADELQKVAQDLAAQAQVKGRELAEEARRQWDTVGKRPPGGAGPSDKQS
jgi:gas vesicle protein